MSSVKNGEGSSDLCDGFDEILIDGDEIRAIFVIHNDIGKADEEPLLFIDRVGDAVPHGRDEKIAHIDAVDGADANANLLPFRHGSLLVGVSLAFTAQKLLTPAQLFILVFAHFLPAFFEHARHRCLPCERESRIFRPELQELREFGGSDDVRMRRAQLDLFDRPFLYLRPC